MKDTRHILVYVVAANEAIRTCELKDVPRKKKFVEIFAAVMAALQPCKGKTEKAEQEDCTACHDFYDWDLKPVDPAVTVGGIANPGIVLAVMKKVTTADTSSLAFGAKVLTEQTQDPVQMKVRDAFLLHGEAASNHKVLELVDAIEAKPSLFGFSLDIMKLLRTFFRRK